MPNRPHRRPTRTAHRQPLPVDPASVGNVAELGWTRSARQHAAERGDLVRLRRGVVVRTSSTDPDEPRWQQNREELWRSALAAAVASPRAVPSHAAAAVGLGLPLLRVPTLPCLTVPAGTALRDLAAAHLHRATLASDDVVLIPHGEVTSPARTVMDLARELGVDTAVVAADAALRTGLVDGPSLATAFEQCRGWPGRKRARVTMLSLDARSESPLESVSRLRLRAAGLPAPQTQVDITDARGFFLGRADFYWDDVGVVGEADGDLKYADRNAVVRERRRQQLFEQTGLLVVRWGMRDLRTFGVVARQLREASARGVRPDSPLRRWHATPAALHPPGSLTRFDAARYRAGGVQRRLSGWLWRASAVSRGPAD